MFDKLDSQSSIGQGVFDFFKQEHLSMKESVDYFLGKGGAIGGNGPAGTNCHGPRRVEIFAMNNGTRQVAIERTNSIEFDVAMAKLELKELQSKLLDKALTVEYLLPILACSQMKEKELCEKIERTKADLYEPD